MSGVAGFVSCFSRAFAAFAWLPSFSLALLAFLSLMYWTRGVMEAFSCLTSAESAPFAVDLVIGSVRLCRKSINSWSWSIVPCRASFLLRPLGILL